MAIIDTNGTCSTSTQTYWVYNGENSTLTPVVTSMSTSVPTISYNDWKPAPIRIRYKTVRGCRIRPVTGFTFGGCAAKAIGVGFKLSHINVVKAFNAYKMDWENGVTFLQCNRVINKLAIENDKTVRYIENKRGMKFLDFVKKNKKGTFICSLDEHVSCVKNGIIVDSFIYHSGPITELEGWWEIKNK